MVEIGVRIRVEIRQRVVDVGALFAGEEDVFRVVLLAGDAERQHVADSEIPGEVILQLPARIAEFVVRREGFRTERRVDRAGVQDVDEREELPDITAALIAVAVADDELLYVALERIEFHSPTNE